MDDLPEVKAIIDRNRAAFVNTINTLVVDISADNKRVIQQCKDELADAKKRIKEYVDSLEPNLQDIGRKAADEMEGKLNQLDLFVAKKEQELQDKLKDKQQASIKAIDEKIEKMKEAISGLVKRQAPALGGQSSSLGAPGFGFSLSDIESVSTRASPCSRRSSQTDRSS